MDSSWTAGNSSSSSSSSSSETTTTDLTSPLLVGQPRPAPADPSDERPNGGAGGFGGRTAAAGSAARSLVQMLSRRRSSTGSGMLDPNADPSAVVRDSAAEQLEERQSEWAYSRPVVVLDFVWNLAFVLVASAVLLISRRERPPAPLRVWILGYALQCLLHIVCVCWEYRRRRQHQQQEWSESTTAEDGGGGLQQASQPHQPFMESESDEDVNDDDDDDSEYEGMGRDNTSVAKRFESANTMFSFIWWIVGFFWITSSGDNLAHNSPCLYWLCVVFLAFDVFFVVFCVALACIIGIAVCCCLPCIIAILYAVADQDGASEEDINALPKYKFQCAKNCDKDKENANKSGAFGGMMIRVSSSGSLDECFLPADKAECCICITPYDDNSEIRELPCKHHFDCACIDKWLRINATCPLCKYNIIKNGSSGRNDDV